MSTEDESSKLKRMRLEKINRKVIEQTKGSGKKHRIELDDHFKGPTLKIWEY